MKRELGPRIVEALQPQADRFGLDGATLRADRILNWGGFVAHSFTVSDGKRSVHLKLATEQGDMRRWLAVHPILERDYRAPRVLAWFDVPDTPFGGLMFEHIDGATWNPTLRPDLIHDLEGLLDRLHHDEGLAQQLVDRPRTYLECWELRYRDQFEEDLKTIRDCRPASVTDDRLLWMERESRKVLAMATDHPAFEGTTQAACHWDLWQNNVMVAESGEWWVLDWDSLAVGDEAEDFATLVWPLLFGTNRDWREWLSKPETGPPSTRMDLHIQAIALDYVIDILADWAECDVPEWRDEVRTRKESEHHQFFDWYRSRWG